MMDTRTLAPPVGRSIRDCRDSSILESFSLGSVYFDMTRYDKQQQTHQHHHRMNEQGVSSLEADILNEKRNVRDFALWKGREKSQSELKFPSPWGYGRPGWHIECSAMTR